MKMFISFIQLQFENESAFEALRQKLNALRRFDPYNAFQYIDRDNDGFLLKEDVNENNFFFY